MNLKHASLALAAIMIALPLATAHSAGPVTTYNINAGTATCDSANGHGGATPIGGSFRVGFPDHVHATLTLNVQNNGVPLCWGRIVLGTPTWVGGVGAVQAKTNDACGPVVVASFCLANGQFDFTRPVHSASVLLPYCIEISLDSKNWFDPAALTLDATGNTRDPIVDDEAITCNEFRFFDPPLVSAGADIYPDDPLGGVFAEVGPVRL